MVNFSEEQSKNRPDRIHPLEANREVQIPMGHYALINSNQFMNGTHYKVAIYGLGSCIALILYDLKKKIGAMSHILLPEARLKKRPDNKRFPHKYADHSVNDLVNEMLKKGATKSNIKAAIFGGSEIFETSDLSIGPKNTKVVKDRLSIQKIELVNEDVGGTRGRVIIYDSYDNSILLKLTGEGNFSKILLK